MDREQSTEPAFTKAVNYLNFNHSACWIAHLAGVGVGLVAVALLSVLWLFADLMVWRGRIPDFEALTPHQQHQFAYLPFSVAKDSEGKSFDQLSIAEKNGRWKEHLRQLFTERISEAATEQVFPRDKDNKDSNVEMDRGDHGFLSLVARNSVSGYSWSPMRAVVPFMARWMPWLWRDADSTLPPYLVVLTLFTLLLGSIGIFLIALNREMAARAVIEATTRLRRAVYHHTFRLGTLAIRAMGPSEAVSLLTRHIEAVHDALHARLTVLYREPIFLGLLLLFALMLNPLLSIVFLLFAVIIWLLGVRLVAYFRRQGNAATHVAAERLTVIRESLVLMRLVKCYMMEQFNQARIERQLVRYGQAQTERHRSESLGPPLLLAMGGVAAVVLMFVGAMAVSRGFLSAAGAVALTACLLCLYRPIERWLQARKLLKRGRESAEQIFGFLDRRGEVGQVVGAEFLPPLARHIEFDNVSLKEPGSGRMLLENVSISIPAGKKVGLCGVDDLEKHALVYLLPRLLDPTSGEIRFDRHNLRWVTLESLRNQIGLVMLSNLVFHDTVRNNIGCGDTGYSAPQLIEAAKLAHAHQFIQKLPQGYDTPIGELGHSLSLSQQYRIALARAILRDPAILIIEEPDTELDEETTQLIDDTIKRVAPERTVIFLPHRISTLKQCDVIYLLSKGRVVASGAHRELLAGSKLYRHLYYIEFNQFDEQLYDASA